MEGIVTWLVGMGGVLLIVATAAVSAHVVRTTSRTLAERNIQQIIEKGARQRLVESEGSDKNIAFVAFRRSTTPDDPVLPG